MCRRQKNFKGKQKARSEASRHLKYFDAKLRFALFASLQIIFDAYTQYFNRFMEKARSEASRQKISNDAKLRFAQPFLAKV